MFQRLEQLSNALGTIDLDQSKQIIEAVNRRVDSLIKCQMIKVYWREEAEGGVILDPLSFINNSRDPNPRPFQVGSQIGGPISWVFENGKPLWFENLKTKDLTSSIQNEVDRQNVDSQHISVSENVDSLLIVPLKVRGETLGVYCIEFGQSGKVSKSLYELTELIGRHLALIIWNADAHDFSLKQTSHAISGFLDSIRDFAFPPIFRGVNYRAGFVARPFKTDYNDFEERICSLLASKGIEARHYEPDAHQGFIISDIITRIQNCHFCLADITECNANVMAEVGMMLSCGKRFLLLRQKGDGTPTPFNLNQFPLYEYDLPGGEKTVRIWSEADGRYQPIDPIVDRFLDELPPDSGFFTAETWPGRVSKNAPE